MKKSEAQLEALQNAVNSTKLDGLKIVIHTPNDKRIREALFLLSLNGTCFSPVLNYDKMNHFLLGFSKALKLWKENQP